MTTTAQQHALASLSAWVVKVLAETTTDNRYKANLISDGLRDYKLTAAQLAPAVGMSLAALNAMLANPIGANEVYTFTNHYGTFKVSLLRWSRIRREIVSQKTALNITYSGHNPTGQTPESWHIDEMAVFLAQHLDTITDLVLMTDDTPSLNPNWDAFGENPAPYQIYLRHLRNKKTGELLVYGTLGEDVQHDPMIWFGSQGLHYDGLTTYCVQFTASGYPIFFNAMVHTQQNDIWASLVKTAVPVIAIAAACFGVPVMLGSFIMGPTLAAAYPAITSAVGGVAMSTALNGGDVNKAVSGAANNFAGTLVGVQVGALADSAALGQLASAATSATFSGGNVNTAVLSRLVTVGASNMDTLFPNQTPTLGDFDDVDLSSEDFSDAFGGGDFDPSALDTDFTLDPAVSDYTPNEFSSDDFGDFNPDNVTIDTAADYTNALSVDADGNVVDAFGDVVIASEEMPNLNEQQIAQRVGGYMSNNSGRAVQEPSGATWHFPSITDMAKTAVFIAQSASQIATSYRQIKSGVAPSTGRVVGVPVTRKDGSIVVNNGNGTQTVTHPNGLKSVERVGTGLSSGLLSTPLISGVSNTTLMLGVGGLLAVAMLARRQN